MLKELLYTGLGATVLLKEKVENELNTLHEKGKLSSEDVKGFIDALESKGKAQDEELKERFKQTLKEVIDELGLATKKDIEDLRGEK